MANVTVALWVRLEAKPGKEKDVENFFEEWAGGGAAGTGDGCVVRDPHEFIDVWNL